MNFDLQQEISDLDLDSSAAQDKVFLSEFQREIQYLNRESIYQAKEILKQVPHLSAKELDKLVNILLTGMESMIQETSSDISNNDQSKYQEDKQGLQVYLFLVHWLFEAMQLPSRDKKGVQWETIGKESSRSRALDCFSGFLSLNLNSIFVGKSELDFCISEFCQFNLVTALESTDVLKHSSECAVIADIICTCAANYKACQPVLLQHLDDLMREEKLADFVAETLNLASEMYDIRDFVQSALKNIGSKCYSDKVESGLQDPKACAKFLIKYSELNPKEIFRNMVSLNELIDSQSHTIRAAMVEVLGNIIHGHLVSDNSPVAAKNVEIFYETLHSRFLDAHHLVRARVLKVIAKRCQRYEDTPEKSDIPLKTRSQLVDSALLRLRDKNSMVRKKAIELMVQFLESNPFISIPEDQGTLSVTKFDKQINSLLEIVNAKFPVEPVNNKSNVDSEAEVKEEIPINDKEKEQMQQIRAILSYYQDAKHFSTQMDECCSIVSELLTSSLKTEVISAMKFFVTAYRFELEGCELGIKKMIHKIWEKDVGDKEGGSVRDVLLTCFQELHIEKLTDQKADFKTAENLIRLVRSMDLAERTSLGELLAILTKTGKLSSSVISTLWSLFGSKNKTVGAEVKLNCLILLGMIGKSDREMLLNNLDSLTRLGLGSLVTPDLNVSKYACVAIQQIFATTRQKGVSEKPIQRFQHDHPTSERLVELLKCPPSSSNWFSFAEQAINTLYISTENPDILCAEIIKLMALRVFPNLPQNTEENINALADQVNQITLDNAKNNPLIGDSEEVMLQKCMDLSYLLFVVGHVAIQQLVNLERIETEWKRKKHAKDGEKGKETTNEDLEMTTGTAEDEFIDVMTAVKERELVFGPNTLLSTFAPVIVYICSNRQKFNHPTLQVVSTATVCKFMCISSTFCEAYSDLLFMILARSKSSIIRANLVIGVGDLVTSFSSLFDSTITYLYQRLKDEDFHVRKNTMMILTFLILNGMIKVKGQISEMALCTEDNDPRIKAMARSFFKELSTKDNAIYNNLPDIISNLSTADETTYRKIVKYLFSFIAKVFDINEEKQQESIVEKLCLRFLHASDQRQWRDIGYCLSLLSFGTEKSFKKLMDALPLYQDKLHEASLYKSLTDIFGRASKGVGKSDLKNLVDDFKEVLAKARQNALDNSDAAKDAVAKADIKLKLPKIIENDGESLENNDADANGPVHVEQYSDADNNPEPVEKASKPHIQDSDATDAEPEPESKIIEDLITPKTKRGTSSNRKKAVGRRRTTRKRTVIADSDDE